MKVLLQSNISNLGHIGELVNVKPGYANNFLFPRGLAVLADESNRRHLEHQMRLAELKKAKSLDEARQMAAQIMSLSITIQKPVGEEDKIFGTVTNQELADAFQNEGYTFDRKSISILDDIKKVGIYKGSVKLHPEVVTEFKIWVTAAQS